MPCSALLGERCAVNDVGDAGRVSKSKLSNKHKKRKKSSSIYSTRLECRMSSDLETWTVVMMLIVRGLVLEEEKSSYLCRRRARIIQDDSANMHN